MNDNMEINKEQVITAVEALKKLAEQQKSDFLSDESTIQLQLGFKKTPKLKSNFIKILLPHTLHTQTSDVCLFVKDLDKNNRDYSASVDHFKDILHQKKVSAVSEVIPLKSLKVEYQPFEAKKNLSNLYGVFLADDRIVRLLPSLLGKHFYGKKRYPVPVNLEAKDLKSEISKALSTIQCALGGRGNTCTLAVGRTGQPSDAVAENVLAATEKLADAIPGGWQNIKTLNVKLVNSIALPIYLSLGSPNEVSISCPRRRVVLDEPEEVTTVLDGKVRVTRHGHVQIVNETTKAFYNKRGQLLKKGKRVLAKQKKEQLALKKSKLGGKKKKSKDRIEGKNQKSTEDESVVKPETGENMESGEELAKENSSPIKSAKTKGGKKRGQKEVEVDETSSKLDVSSTKLTPGSKKRKPVKNDEDSGGKTKKITGQQKDAATAKKSGQNSIESGKKAKQNGGTEQTGRGAKKRKFSEGDTKDTVGSELAGKLDRNHVETNTPVKLLKSKTAGKSMERPMKKTKKAGAGKPSPKILK